MGLLSRLAAAFVLLGTLSGEEAAAQLRAGAAVVDATPIQFPVFVNGGMTSRSLDVVKTKINVRAIVLDDGDSRIGIAVVDSCMLPRPFLDEAKQLASQRTQIRPDRMLISATHTHSAPASMSCLGTDADPTYVPYLREKIAEALAAAEANLEPARVGWAVANAAEFTALRRWIRRPDRLADDPFGNPTVRANMHAGANWDDVTGESGPEDPDLSLISFQAKDGRPIALLANFSMHYFSGEQGLSADYFGLFSDGLKTRLAPNDEAGNAPFVGIMSHGCSGDIWRRDYRIPPVDRTQDPTIESYANGLFDVAMKAYESISYDDSADLAMAETRMELKYRVPDKQRLEWSRRIVEGLGDQLPKTTEEVYAREQIILHERQSTEIVVQALRIGSIAIVTTPCETYALTGLKLKLQSPLPRTMVIELANGGDGYIPSPEQHLLGGYNTWPARSAGLEVQAEPKIVAAGLQLLEQVAGKPRTEFKQSQGAGVSAILTAKPVAYWRLDEFAGPVAGDLSGHDRHATYEPGVVYFLTGPRAELFCTASEENRAAHFAGGRLRAQLGKLGDRYSVSMWFWNGMPTDARSITGWLYSRGDDFSRGEGGEHFGLGGGEIHPGKLVFENGDNLVAGHTTIERWTWNHLLFVRDGAQVRVYLNGEATPEIEAARSTNDRADSAQLFFGGHCSGDSSWEGRLDEIAVFDRVIAVKELLAE
ncbi:MAG: LamG-like jellyroll fold domain-containing protein [Planctomycetota bacterium]